MTPLTVFEICAAIAVATVVIPYLILGDGIILLIIIFPAMAAERITNERGLDLSRKSFSYLILLYLFILTEILLLATILFGGYCLFWGYPTTIETAAETALVSRPKEISSLILAAKLLLLFISYFTCMFIYNSIKYRESYRQLKKSTFIQFQILPLFIFPLGFIYLFACLHYLTNFPAYETIGKLPVIAGCMYATYIVYYLGNMLFLFAKNARVGFTHQPFKQLIRLFITLCYDCCFLYFFFQMYPALKV